jgi:dihydrofolate synthase/folylpolyglutamate synthase
MPRLPGRHQVINAGTAIAALRQCLPILPLAAFELGVARATWPGRLQNLNRGRLAELMPEGAELWLDGGHNEAGGRVLAEAMAEFEDKAPRPLVLLYGGLQTKDASGFLRHFVGLAAEVLALPVPGEQAGRSPDEVAAIAGALGIRSRPCSGVDEALGDLAGRNWPQPPRILIAGSLYLVGETLAANGTPPV